MLLLLTKNGLDSLFKVRKILVATKFLSAILGLEMGAPILWVPGIFTFFLQENLHVHKIPRFRGGGILGFFGGGSAVFIFMGVGIFLIRRLVFSRYIFAFARVSI